MYVGTKYLPTYDVVPRTVTPYIYFHNRYTNEQRCISNGYIKLLHE